jgi:hypothetical protein
MAGKLSDAGGDVAVKAVCGITPSGNRYLALCSSAPTDSALGTEIATPGTSGYARQLVTFAAPVDNAGARECRNNAIVQHGPFSADLASVTHVMLMDDSTAATAAHMLGWASLDTARDPGINDLIRFAVGDLAFSVD